MVPGGLRGAWRAAWLLLSKCTAWPEVPVLFPSALLPSPRAGVDMISKMLKMQMLEDEDDLAYAETEKKTRTDSTADGRPAWMRTLHTTASNWLHLIPQTLSHLKRTVDNIKVAAAPCPRAWGGPGGAEPGLGSLARNPEWRGSSPTRRRRPTQPFSLRAARAAAAGGPASRSLIRSQQRPGDAVSGLHGALRPGLPGQMPWFSSRPLSPRPPLSVPSMRSGPPVQIL